MYPCTDEVHQPHCRWFSSCQLRAISLPLREVPYQERQAGAEEVIVPRLPVGSAAPTGHTLPSEERDQYPNQVQVWTETE